MDTKTHVLLTSDEDPIIKRVQRLCHAEADSLVREGKAIRLKKSDVRQIKSCPSERLLRRLTRRIQVATSAV